MSIAGIYSDIYTSLASNKAIFPSLPETTIRLRETLHDPKCNIDLAARLLKTDPGLAAFIMRMANSVRYLTRFPPKDIESALRRIGLTTTSQLVTTFAIRSSFDSPTPKLKKQLIAAYRRATRVSVISYFLADQLSSFDPSKAMLAGLLQDIALPPILLHLSERPDIFDDPARLTEAVDRLAPLVGILILKNWKFSDDLIEVVRSRKQWMRDPGATPDLGDIVLIARLHSLIGTPEFKECPTFDIIPAFHKLPVGELTPGQSLKILHESQDEIAELEKMLNGL